jgi:hypothetical protein
MGHEHAPWVHTANHVELPNVRGRSFETTRSAPEGTGNHRSAECVSLAAARKRPTVLSTFSSPLQWYKRSVNGRGDLLMPYTLMPVGSEATHEEAGVCDSGHRGGKVDKDCGGEARTRRSVGRLRMNHLGWSAMFHSRLKLMHDAKTSDAIEA